MHTGHPISGHYIPSSIAPLYNVLPWLWRMLIWLVAPTLSLEIRNEKAMSSLTRGLVGDSSFAILPEITSRTTFIITFIAQLV